MQEWKRRRRGGSRASALERGGRLADCRARRKVGSRWCCTGRADKSCLCCVCLVSASVEVVG